MNCSHMNAALQQQYCGLAHHTSGLPYTGMDIAWVVALAVVLILIGILLRVKSGGA